VRPPWSARAGGKAAVNLLHEAGFRSDIALLGQSDAQEIVLFRSETVTRRIHGIRSQIRRCRMSFLAEESCWNWEPDEGYRLAKRMLKREHGIKAMLCMNDRLAFGAYQAAAELGLEIPIDLSIVSFDDDEIASYLRPGLTTIALPHKQMGVRSVELLLSGGGKGENLVPMPVVRRGSITTLTR
jgi:LacI family transcriptional regulator